MYVPHSHSIPICTHLFQTTQYYINPLNTSQDLVNMYKTIAWRFKSNRLFLPRNLWRNAVSVNDAMPTILYVTAHNDFSWCKLIKRMRCLWCRNLFFRFANLNELLLHLQRCHDQFGYKLGGRKTSDIGGKNRIVEVIYVRCVSALPVSAFSSDSSQPLS